MKEEFLSHSDAAQLNRNAVLHYVKTHGPVSRTDIWENMNISRASVTQVIRQLQETNLIVETGEKQFSGGRMSRLLRLNPDARYMYAFDWITRLVCIVNLGGEILASIPLEFPRGCTPSEFSAVVLSGVSELEKKYPADPENILGIAIALPGLLDPRKRMSLYSVELGWRDVDIHYLFKDKFGDNVYLERTANMIALGECVFGAGRDNNHIMMILLTNEGIGTAAVVRGNCQHGSNYMYGELGHIKLPSTVMCSCGQQGCLEAVVRDHLMNNGGVVDETLLDYISYGVSTAVNICDPGIIIMTGALVSDLTQTQKDFLFNAIRRKVTDERSRSLTLHISGDIDMMCIRGLSAYIFSSHFAVS